MGIFYHLDRIQNYMFSNFINNGVIDQLEISQNDNLYDVTIFKEGLSMHGFQYLTGNLYGNEHMCTAFKECIFELIRQQHFPDAYSRYQSMYAFTEMDGIYKFIDKYSPIIENNVNFSIWELETENYQEYDMNWFSCNETNINDLLKHAIKYWSCEKTEDPHMECLLKPKIKIIRKLTPAFRIGSEVFRKITFE